jgi:hypothetical protein
MFSTNWINGFCHFWFKIDQLPNEISFNTGNDQIAMDDQPGSPLDPIDYSRLLNNEQCFA